MKLPPPTPWPDEGTQRLAENTWLARGNVALAALGARARGEIEGGAWAVTVIIQACRNGTLSNHDQSQAAPGLEHARAS